MIGTVIVTHGQIGEELVRVTLSIVKEANPMIAVSLEHSEDVDLMRRKVQDAIHKADQGEGVLLLSDMFGGTPCNLCLSFLGTPKVEVVSGVNLPMLIKLASLKEAKKLSEIADFIKSYGQKNITRATEVLRASGPTGKGPTADGHS